jgi:hypothetical protein
MLITRGVEPGVIEKIFAAAEPGGICEEEKFRQTTVGLIGYSRKLPVGASLTGRGASLGYTSGGR